MSEEFETPRSRVEAILQNMLGAENVLPPPQSRIEYYLQKILEEGGGSSTFKTFNSDWVTDSTTAAFCASVNSDPEAVAGMAYLGELTCSDLPFNGNADAVVEIIDGSGTSGKIIHIVITSGNIAPYRWEYTYWNDGANVSGWIAFATTDTVQANPTLEGTEPDLTGLVVNGVKYKAGGGGLPLYLHCIHTDRTGAPGATFYGDITINVITSDAQPYTKDDFAQKIYDAYGRDAYIVANGVYLYNSSLRPVTSVRFPFSPSASSFGLYANMVIESNIGSFVWNPTTVNDFVKQLI